MLLNKPGEGVHHVQALAACLLLFAVSAISLVILKLLKVVRHFGRQKKLMVRYNGALSNSRKC